MFDKWFHKKAKKLGYIKLEQVKIGGTCGCCGKSMSNLLWVNYHEGFLWEDIGVCQQCLDEGDGIISISRFGDGDYIFTKKKQRDFLLKMGEVAFKS